MKKVVLVLGTVALIILFAVIAFDSSSTPSANNEGMKKPALTAHIAQ